LSLHLFSFSLVWHVGGVEVLHGYLGSWLPSTSRGSRIDTLTKHRTIS